MKTTRKSALIAGITLLVMSVAAIISYGYIHNALMIPGNPKATLENLSHSNSLFGMELLGWLIIFICDLIVAWALYVFFKNVNQKLSLLSALIRTVYTFVLGGAIFNLLQVYFILVNKHLPLALMQQKISDFVLAFETTWSLGLILFGFHLLLLGYLAIKSTNIHSIWGILLIIAGISYIFVHASKQIFTEHLSLIHIFESILSLPMAFGEIGFAFWLVIKGGRNQ